MLLSNCSVLSIQHPTQKTVIDAVSVAQMQHLDTVSLYVQSSAQSKLAVEFDTPNTESLAVSTVFPFMHRFKEDIKSMPISEFPLSTI